LILVAVEEETKHKK